MKLTKEQMQAAIQQIEADGWCVVPKEPTVKILEEIRLDGNFSYLAMVNRYEAMLSAAPKYLPAQERHGEQAALAKLHKQEPIAWPHSHGSTEAATKCRQEEVLKAGGVIKKDLGFFTLSVYGVNSAEVSDDALNCKGTKNLEQHRFDFEVWAIEEGLALSRSPLGEYYADMVTDYAWAAWQASKGI